jgi:hypothetical protein
MKFILISLAFIISHSFALSQTIEKPNFSSASHPMTVDKIEFTKDQAIISLSIENHSETGYFCADKNISLIDALTNKKYKLIKSENIPVCPESYSFKMLGEILQFKLFFPKPNPSSKYVNIIEDCEQNCFSINGIILDMGMNKEIDLVFDNYAKQNSDLALPKLLEIIENHPDYSFGYLYANLIQVYAEKNDFINAKNYFKILYNSKFQDKTEVINSLKRFNFYSKLIF